MNLSKLNRLFFLFSFFPLAPLWASDHTNLEENLPVSVTDAVPTEYMNREIQGRFRYEQDKGKNNEFVIEPRIEYGFLRNWQAEMDIPFAWGEAVKDDGLEDVELSALFNFNQETTCIPALAASGKVIFGDTEDNEGTDTQLTLIASKLLGKTSFFNRLHLNARWRHNAEAPEEQRREIYTGIVGYDFRFGPDTLVILDYVREQQIDKGKNSNIFELGLRRQLSPPTVISVATGTGAGEDSPDFRITLGVQRSF